VSDWPSLSDQGNAMPTSPTTPRSTIYIHPEDAQHLRDLAAELGLVQVGGGGERYQAGSLSALMRFLAASSRGAHRPHVLRFLRALKAATR
jgi:hypothetical protein